MVWRRIAQTLREGPLTVTPGVPDAPTMAALAARLAAAAQTRLGRSLAIRHVDAGSCNGCELETVALGNVVYDLERFGLRFVPSPRHADVLLVTGPLTRNMIEALRLTWQAMPDPKWVVAVGDCAADGGVFRGSYAVAGSGAGGGAGGGESGVGAAVPVDLLIRGCPPTPAQILDGLRALVEAGR